MGEGGSGGEDEEVGRGQFEKEKEDGSVESVEENAAT